MQVTMPTKAELTSREQLLDELREIDREQLHLRVRMALIRARLSRPAIPAPAWFQELL